MKFTYKNNEYELMLMDEPNTNKTFDILGIFKVKYVIIENNEKIEVSKNDDFDFEDYEYINYFCNQGDTLENVEIAKHYIDEWHEQKTKTKLAMQQALELLQEHFNIDKDFMSIDYAQKWIDCIETLKKI